MQQRYLIGMIDGLGTDYLAASPMPHLKRMMAEGFHRDVKAVMPTVTNANNVSICCGAWPAEHGITGNSYLDEARGEAEYMENADFIRIPTLIQRARAHGVKTALLTSKRKTINLLARDADIAIAAEDPPAEFIERYGKPADIYSREINYWLWEVAIDLLKTRPDLGFIYVHTTDYPMHMWTAEDVHSQEHLARLDELIFEAVSAAPDIALLLTADHGMNGKTQCWDIGRASAARGLELRFALSAERDRYIKHHRTFGGTGWVWLKQESDKARAIDILSSLPGIEDVIERDEAARRFNLMPERIGELVVLGDKNTVFGDLETGEREELEAGYRSHGSLHELDVPLVIYNFDGALPEAEAFTANLDVTRHTLRPLWQNGA